MKLFRLIPDGTTFKFMDLRRYSFPFSAVLSLVCLIGFLVFGLNAGVDFKGGSLLELQASKPSANISDLRETMNKLKLGDVQVQEFGGATNFMVRYPDQAGGEEGQKKAFESVKEALKDNYTIRRNEVVGPRVSQELLTSSTIGVILSILAVLVYLWVRFEWQFAVGAMVATVHDCVAMFGFFTFSQMDFDMTSIAAILTIIGFSMNDTVVVYDRIREMMRKYKKMSISDLLDLSINNTLPRTVITSVTVFLSLLGLYFFGGDAIHGFAAAMLVGVIVGVYSSIFVAAPILIYLGVTSSSVFKQEESKQDARP